MATPSAEPATGPALSRAHEDPDDNVCIPPTDPRQRAPSDNRRPPGICMTAQPLRRHIPAAQGLSSDERISLTPPLQQFAGGRRRTWGACSGRPAQGIAYKGQSARGDSAGSRPVSECWATNDEPRRCDAELRAVPNNHGIPTTLGAALGSRQGATPPAEGSRWIARALAAVRTAR